MAALETSIRRPPESRSSRSRQPRRDGRSMKSGSGQDRPRPARDPADQPGQVGEAQIGAEQAVALPGLARFQGPAVGDRGHAGVDDRDAATGQEGHRAPGHQQEQAGRGWLRVSRADDHPRAEDDAGQTAAQPVEDDGLGLALGPFVGGADVVEVPGRRLVGRDLGRAGGQRVQRRGVDETLDPRRDGLGQKVSGRLDVHRRPDALGVRAQADPARGVDHPPDVRQGPSAVGRLAQVADNPLDRRDRPAARRGGRRVEPPDRVAGPGQLAGDVSTDEPRGPRHEDWPVGRVEGLERRAQRPACRKTVGSGCQRYRKVGVLLRSRPG